MSSCQTQRAWSDMCSFSRHFQLVLPCPRLSSVPSLEGPLTDGPASALVGVSWDNLAAGLAVSDPVTPVASIHLALTCCLILFSLKGPVTCKLFGGPNHVLPSLYLLR